MRYLLKEPARSARFPHPIDMLVGPPPEVLDEVAEAWERAAGLAEELDVVLDADSGRVRGVRRGADGAPELLSALELLAAACGDPVETLAA